MVKVKSQKANDWASCKASCKIACLYYKAKLSPNIPLGMEAEANALKLGDVISLFSQEGNGFLASEGSCDFRTLLYHVVSDEIGNNPQMPLKFSDCLFRVLPQLANTQAKALRKLSKKMAAKKEQTDTESKVSLALPSTHRTSQTYRAAGGVYC